MNATNGSQGGDEGIDLSMLFRSLWRRKWIVVICALLGAALALAAVSRQTPLYTAQSSLMLDPRSIRVMSDEAVISDPDLNDGLMESAVAVLRSNLLIEDVINSFEPEVLAPLDPVSAAPDAGDGLGARIKNGIDGLAQTIGLTWADAPEPVPAIEAMSAQDQRLRRLVAKIRSSIRVWRAGDSYVIMISVEMESPELAALIANRIASQYIDRSVRERSETARAAATWLGERTAELREQLETAEARVEEMRVTQLDEDGVSLEAISQQQLQLNTQLAVAQADTASATARYNQIERVMEDGGMTAAAELVTSPFVLSLRQELSNLERQDLDLASQFGPEYPERQRIAASIELTETSLVNEVRSIVSGLRNDVAVAQAREAVLRSSLATLEARHAAVSRASTDLRQLEREAESARKTYEEALSRFNETRTAEQFQNPDARLVERAVVPAGASAPRPKLFTVFGGIIGFSIGLVLAFLSAFMRRGFGLAHEVEHATGVRVLASLPAGRWRSRSRMLQDLVKDPYHVFAERVRQLRAVLGGPRGERAPRSVIVTSALSSEGKTSTALALALSEARSGKRTILLDLDTRRSPLQRELGLTGSYDLDAYLRGECDIQSAICPLPGLDFDLLTNIAPNRQSHQEITPSALRDLLDVLGETYDRVIIDAPPLLSVSETLTYCSEAQAVLVVVRHRATSAPALRDALKRLRDMQIEPVGLVLTMTDLREESIQYAAEQSYAYNS
ncbi:GumC family protein [Limimaricola cinnabarinus]|nr:polysaccharide biosynthesis tyrosine autokinase [Limimaricola cinnabarinus]